MEQSTEQKQASPTSGEPRLSLLLLLPQPGVQSKVPTTCIQLQMLTPPLLSFMSVLWKLEGGTVREGARERHCPSHKVLPGGFQDFGKVGVRVPSPPKASQLLSADDHTSLQ